MNAQRPVEQITAFGAPVDPDVKRRSSVDLGSRPPLVASADAPRCVARRSAYPELPESKICGTP